MRTRYSLLIFLLGMVSSVPGADATRILSRELAVRYFQRFNKDDAELYRNAIPNCDAARVFVPEIPLFECPDKEIERTYYFRWWVFRKHLRRTRTGTGWVVTEFLPDVPWAGPENTIAYPLGHHLREGRWIRNPVYVDSYFAFMLNEGVLSGPRAYVCWPAWGALERAKVTGDFETACRFLPVYVRHVESWKKGWEVNSFSLRRVENVKDVSGVPIRAGFRTDRGLFDFVGDREGSEFALSEDGARPLVNSAMWAEATAISEIAHRSGDENLACRYADFAAELAKNIKGRLWNNDRRFFTVLSVDGRQDDVCELHGYAPFYFGMEMHGFEDAWMKMTGETGFAAPRGLAFPARDTKGFDLKFDLKHHECLWNGPSWPYATSIALTALYASLQGGNALPIDAADFVHQLHQYAAQQVLIKDDGSVVSWIDENLDPFSGVWLARRQILEWDRRGMCKMSYPERGKDYNHSTFCDLVIAGLCGIVPQSDGKVVLKPLAPKEWDWWCVDGVCYHGRNLTVLFDRDGSRYGKGQGLVVLEK